MSFIDDLRALSKAWDDLSEGNARPLAAEEITEAKRVFEDTIHYQNVLVVDRFGYGGRPFTLYFPKGSMFLLYLGPTQFQTMSSDWPTFIHEMTHVWQGQTHSISAGYMLNSCIAQAIHGNKAYDYEVGQPWDEYNVEQQAHLVEDWYADGCALGSPRYPYIRDDIRHPGPTALDMLGRSPASFSPPTPANPSFP